MNPLSNRRPIYCIIVRVAFEVVDFRSTWDQGADVDLSFLNGIFQKIVAIHLRVRIKSEFVLILWIIAVVICVVAINRIRANRNIMYDPDLNLNLLPDFEWDLVKHTIILEIKIAIALKPPLITILNDPLKPRESSA